MIFKAAVDDDREVCIVAEYVAALYTSNIYYRNQDVTKYFVSTVGGNSFEIPLDLYSRIYEYLDSDG